MACGSSSTSRAPVIYKPLLSSLADIAQVVFLDQPGAVPILVLGGEDDPMTPIECQADLAVAIPAHLARFGEGR